MGYQYHWQYELTGDIMASTRFHIKATSLFLFSEILILCGLTVGLGHTRFSNWSVVLWQFGIPSVLLLTVPFWLRDILKRERRKQAVIALLVALPSVLMEAWAFHRGG
jgi:hypothetical protein